MVRALKRTGGILLGGCLLLIQTFCQQQDDDFLWLLALANSGNGSGSSTTTTCEPTGGATACELTLNGDVTTLAGTALNYGSADGTGAAASFTLPRGITSDGTNLYICDSGSMKIRKVVIATGEVTTLAGSGSTGSADGTGTAASFNSPYDITTDGANLYLIDYGNRKIRKIVVATAEVTTLAGSGSTTVADGTGTAASFEDPFGITTDGTNLYVSESKVIRKIEISSRIVTTLAGSGSFGSADGTGTAASFSNAYGITTDGTTLYVVDQGNNKIRKIVIATAEVTTLAGSGSSGSADGTGTAASFNSPAGMTMDGTNLYVADNGNHKIRKIVIASAEVTTLAGSGSSGSSDGTGSAATFNNPYGITTDGSSLFVADFTNSILRRIQ